VGLSKFNFAHLRVSFFNESILNYCPENWVHYTCMTYMHSPLTIPPLSYALNQVGSFKKSNYTIFVFTLLESDIDFWFQIIFSLSK